MLVVTFSNASLDVTHASFGVTGSDSTQYRSGTRSASLNTSPEDVSDSLDRAYPRTRQPQVSLRSDTAEQSQAP